MDEIKKPPLGVKPLSFVCHERAIELFAAIERYRDADKPIPASWIDELKDIVTYLFTHTKNKTDDNKTIKLDRGWT